MGGTKLTKIGGVPYFGQFMFYLKAPGKNLTGDHQNTVDPCYGQYEFAGGLPPPLLIPILVNLVPPPHHWALFWSMYYLPPPLIPVMVNLSSIGGCGVIIQHYSPHVALLWSIYHHLGALTTIFDQHCPHSRKLFYHNTKYTHYRFLHIWPWRNWLPSLS